MLEFAEFVSALGSPVAIGVMFFLSCAVLLFYRNYSAALFLTICISGALILNVSLKAIFHVARPDTLAGQEAHGYRFPSGHTLGTVVFFGAILYLLWPRLSAAFRMLSVLCYAAGMGLLIWSRLYLGVHMPIDVSASVLIGFSWLGLGAITFKKVFGVRLQFPAGPSTVTQTSTDPIPEGTNALVVLLNRSAGTFKNQGSVLIDNIRARLQQQTRPFALWEVRGSELTAKARQAISQGAKTIVIAGGDGSVGATAAALLGTDTVLGILPLGTLNHLARDLGIPTALDEALNVIIAGDSIQIDVGKVNGHVFINNSSLGLYPSVVLARDQFSAATGAGKWSAFLNAAWRVFGSYANYDLEIELPEKSIARHTPFVFVGNNTYSFSIFNLGERTAIDRGILSLHTVHNLSRSALLAMVMRTLVKSDADNASYDSMEGSRFVIKCARKKILVATDGEVLKLEPPLRYEIHPKALRVCVPSRA